MHMRDANAMQLRLNQIDLNVNAEMQLGKSGWQSNCTVVQYIASQHTLSWSSDLVNFILVFCSREMTWLHLVMSE